MTGTVGDPALIAWCRAELGAVPVRVLFTKQATSEVVGVRIDDGREVVIKRRRESIARVDACLRLQAALFASNYPCPRPLTGAGVVGGLTVHAEEYVDRGERWMGDHAALAAPLAIAYAELDERLERMHDLIDAQVLVPPRWIAWWSQRPWSRQPVVPNFVYDAADRVRKRLSSVYLTGVIGHADWEAQNLRASNGRLVVVHDWDSLSWAPEAMLVGCAAAVFPAQEQPETASLSSSATFLEHYQVARGREFTPDEIEVAWAAGLLPSLFNARNEVLEGRRRPLVLDRLRDECADRLALAGA